MINALLGTILSRADVLSTASPLTQHTSSALPPALVRHPHTTFRDNACPYPEMVKDSASPDTSFCV